MEMKLDKVPDFARKVELTTSSLRLARVHSVRIHDGNQEIGWRGVNHATNRIVRRGCTHVTSSYGAKVDGRLRGARTVGEVVGPVLWTGAALVTPIVSNFLALREG